MKLTLLATGIVFAMATIAEAGPGGRGGDSKGGDTKSGKGGIAGVGGNGGDSKGGDTKGGSSVAKGNGGPGAPGGSSRSGAVGAAGESETKVGGTTYVFSGDTFGAGVTIGGAQNVQGGTGGTGGTSGASVAGAGGNGGDGPQSGPGGSSGPGGNSGPGGKAAKGGDANGGKNGPGGSSGPGGKGGKGGDFDLSLPPIPIPRRARDLFSRAANGDSVYARKESNGQLLVRASKGPVASEGGPAKGGPAPPNNGGPQKVNEAGELTIDAIVQMIVHKQAWPPALVAAFAGSKMAQEWVPPAHESPCDPVLCNHPSTHAVEVLKSGQIPGEIMKAIANPANGWTKKGAAGANGASVKGKSTAGTPAKAKSGAPPAQAKKPKRNVGADASFYDSELFARYAYPEAFYDSKLFTRDVDDSYSSLFSRDAEAEYYDDFDLYARDAESDFDDHFGVYKRDAEAWYDDGEVFPREDSSDEDLEKVAHMSDGEMKKLFQTLQTNKKAQAAVMKVVNEDPYLAHYAHELEDNYE
ncbi:hypothetical protein MMC26_005570 [Xylographa opegraphella]|nr:hypothetical protein [Xylographa opegraphella]